jgi:hypothetical protein
MMERQDRVTRDRLTIVTYPGAYHDFDVEPRLPASLSATTSSTTKQP